VVNPASITVTALGGFSTYGSSPSNPGLSATGLQNGQSVSVLTGLSNSFGISNTSNAGSYTLDVAGTLTNSNYTIAGTTNGSWTVNPASVNVTALGGFSTYGSSPANPGLSATGLQNGQSVGALTGLSNSFGISNTSSAGNYTLDVAGTLTNPNYVVAGTTSGSWTVNPASVTVTALGGSSTYGSSPSNPGLSATGLQNGQGVSILTGLSNSFGISNTSNAGSYTLDVAGTLTNSNYTIAGTSSGSWTVNPASVTVTALGGSSTYGSSPSNPGLSATGLQNGQSASALTGLSNSFGISNTSNAGSYMLDVAGTLSNSNYTVAGTNTGSWTVNPASVTVTALGGSSTYGSQPSNPGLSASGLQNGQSVSALTGLSNSFGISNTSSAGNYTLNVAGTLTNSNYTVASTNTGSWTVNPAPVSVSVAALGGSSTYGSSPANPGLSATGLQNGQNASVLTGLRNSFGISNTSNAGSYTLDVVGTLTNSNYTVASTTSGTWTVNPAAVSVSALGGSSIYGSSPANPGLAATGLQNGQNVSVLTGLRNSFGISNTSNAGSYALDVVGTLTNPNYTVAGANIGSWTVNPASVSVSALGGSSTYGSSPANPGLAATGLQNGETVGVLTGLRNSFGITSASNVGNYTLEVTGTLTNPNYTVASTSNGSWIVGAATVLRGSMPLIPGIGDKGPPSSADAGALNGLDNLSAVSSGRAGPGAASANPRPPAAAAKTPAAADKTQAAAGPPPASPLPRLDTLRADAPPASAPTSGPVAQTGCSGGKAGDPGCDAVVPNKPAGLIDFVLSKLNRDAFAGELDRGLAQLRNSESLTGAILTTVAGATSVTITIGILGWLERGGALLSALLTSMPVLRGFDPLVVFVRPRRDEEDAAPPSDVERMFDDARSDRPVAEHANVIASAVF